MGILSGIGHALRAVADSIDITKPRDQWEPRYWGALNGGSVAGVAVTDHAVAQLGAVQSVRYGLSSALSTLPVMVYRRGADGARQPLPDHPVSRLLGVRPNGVNSPAEFIGELGWHLSYYRNAFCKILPPGDNLGPDPYGLGGLELIHPRRLAMVERRYDGRLYYTFNPPATIVQGSSLQPETFRDDEIWHLRGNPLREDGLLGEPIFETAKNVFGRAIAVHDYGDSWFANFGGTGGILKHPGTFKDKDQENDKTALDQLNALLAKDNATEAEKAQIVTLEAQVDTIEKEVATLDGEIATEEKAARRANLFTTTAGAAMMAATSAFGGHALATVVHDTDPARTAGFKSLPEFANAVRNLAVAGLADPRFSAAASGFQQNQGAAGEGVLVPLEWREAIWSLVFDDNDLLGFCNPEPTQGNSVGIIKDETTPWGASGVQAAWRSEGTQMLASKAAATPTLMQLHELFAFVLATQEILDDAPRLQNRLTIQAARAIRWKAFEAVMWGDGVGKPLGFMKSPALVTVAAENGQAAGSIVTANVLKMASRLLEMPGGAPQWLANRDAIPQLGTLTIGNNAAWLPVNGALSGGAIRRGGIMLGEQLTFNEHCQTTGTLGDIVMADLSGYALATKQGGGIDFASSIHLFFDQNISAFRWIFRVGGQPYLSAPVAAAKGNSSKSHFVALATRS